MTMPKNVQNTAQLHSSHMLKILQVRLQQYMNQELPYVQAGFRKGRGTRNKIANIRWTIRKQESSRKPSISALSTTPKPLAVWKSLQEMRIPDHFTCLLRNLCAGQEAAVRTEHGTTDLFQIGKGVH